MRKAPVKTSKNISSKSRILLAYIQNEDILERTIREASVVILKIEKESANMGLQVNEDKTKLIISMSKVAVQHLLE